MRKERQMSPELDRPTRSQQQVADELRRRKARLQSSLLVLENKDYWTAKDKRKRNWLAEEEARLTRRLKALAAD